MPGAASRTKLGRAFDFYEEHVDLGVPMREIARQNGLHASTVLRAIRRIENSRDEDVVTEEACMMAEIPAELHGPALVLMRRLAEPGAVLVSSPAIKSVIVVRLRSGSEPVTTCSMPVAVAASCMRRGWLLRVASSDRAVRHRISSEGRAWLRDELRAQARGAERQASAR